MRAVLDDSTWDTRAVTTGDVVDTYRARDLMRLIAEGTYVCGDPGMQFDTTINEWHTCPETDRIYASNPCSEYMFLDDSACNLASINLMKFVKVPGVDLGAAEFDVASYKAAIRTLITAQEIIVDNASYPTEAIGRNSHAYRPLGLGYANLGALLMSRGLPYDSEAGRDCAAALTAFMTGEAYTQLQIDAIVDYIDKNETIEGAPALKESHLPVFDCAFKAAKGNRSIHYMGHIKMMGATQPFISGAISKTVNVPKEATVDEIMQAYVQSWKLGAKAISIYRDGSKRTQPLNTSRDKPAAIVADAAAALPRTPVRRKLPDERKAITHKFD